MRYESPTEQNGCIDQCRLVKLMLVGVLQTRVLTYMNINGVY